jgi:hypothetical protein
MAVVRAHPNGVLRSVVEHRLVPDGPAIGLTALHPFDCGGIELRARVERKKERPAQPSRPPARLAFFVSA